MKKIGKIGEREVFSAHQGLPWDNAKLIACIAQAGEGEYGEGKLTCHTGVWTAAVTIPFIGIATIPISIEEIWAGVQADWDVACADCNSQSAELELDLMAQAPWAYPADVEEREREKGFWEE